MRPSSAMYRVSLPRLTAIFLPLLLLAAGTACSDGAAQTAKFDTLAPDPGARESETALLALVNDYRATLDLPALAAEPRLSEAARRHAEDMASRDFFDHTTPDGRGLGARVGEAGYRYFLVAENIARGQRSAAEAFTAWRHSPGHDRNMRLSEARQAGIGLALRIYPQRHGITERFWVFIFATPQ